MAATVAGIQEADGVVYCMPPVIASGITIFGNGPEDLVGELYECLECEITFQELGDLFRHLETTGKCRWLLTHSQRMGGLIDSLREHLYVDPEEGAVDKSGKTVAPKAVARRRPGAGRQAPSATPSQSAQATPTATPAPSQQPGEEPGTSQVTQLPDQTAPAPPQPSPSNDPSTSQSQPQHDTHTSEVPAGQDISQNRSHEPAPDTNTNILPTPPATQEAHPPAASPPITEVPAVQPPPGADLGDQEKTNTANVTSSTSQDHRPDSPAPTTTATLVDVPAPPTPEPSQQQGVRAEAPSDGGALPRTSPIAETSRTAPPEEVVQTTQPEQDASEPQPIYETRSVPSPSKVAGVKRKRVQPAGVPQEAQDGVDSEHTSGDSQASIQLPNPSQETDEEPRTATAATANVPETTSAALPQPEEAQHTADPAETMLNQQEQVQTAQPSTRRDTAPKPSAKRRKKTTAPPVEAATPSAASTEAQQVTAEGTADATTDATSDATTDVTAQPAAAEEPASASTQPKPKAPRKPRAKKATGTTTDGVEAAGDAAPEAAPKKRKRKVLSAARVTEDEDGEGQTNSQADGADNAAQADGEAPTPAKKPRQRKPAKPRAKPKPKTKTSTPEGAEAATGEAGGDADAPEEEIPDPELHEIDATATMMFDLTRDRGLGKSSEREAKMATIDWGEVARKRREAAEALVAGASTEGRENGDGGDEGEAQEGADASTPAIPAAASGPRLRIVNGEMVVDESTLRVDRAARAAHDAAGMEGMEDNDLTQHVNRYSWINDKKREPTERVPFFKMKSDPWSEEETDRFFEALRMFGTDFFILSKMFVPKTRRQIKLKFIREERLDPDRVNRALAGESVPMDLNTFAEATGRQLDDFKDPAIVEQELAQEGLEQKEEIEKKRKEMQEQQKQRDIQMQARERDQAERQAEKDAQKAQRAAARARKRGGAWGNGTF
ncbi:hypothetical protein M8818_004854 [Zalaria obscura]|uniref:Uncharacterized protein n=1 Tax=Zalaria obscura TaxID=2024903 RepID=A0ACC3SAR3_9PEZI